MYSENFGFGLRVFIIKRAFNNRMKGLIRALLFGVIVRAPDFLYQTLMYT